MTLLDVLLDAVREAPGQTVVHVRGDGSELTVTLSELLDDALRVDCGFREAGVARGTCVPLFADRSEDFQPMFWGAVAAGLVPVPLAPDTRRALPVWEHLGRPPVVVDAATASLVAASPPRSGSWPSTPCGRGGGSPPPGPTTWRSCSSRPAAPARPKAWR